jgi:hypothetical protein
VAGAEFLGERLRAFEAGRSGARAERRNTGRFQPVDQAKHKWQLRPRHHQLDILVPAEGDDAADVVLPDRHAGRLARDRIATRRAVQLIDQGRCGKSPAQCMLAPACAHDQYLHADASSVIAPSGL